MTKKILIIEDDEFLRTLIIRKLVEEGFDVVKADDGREGLEKVKTENPDLILLDLVLPKIDGFKVLDSIKKDPAIASIPVIIITNLDQKESIKKVSHLIVDYLIKAQNDPIEIIKKIKKALK